MRSSISHHLHRLAQQIDLPLAPRHEEQLVRFLELLLRWNAKVNLTGARTAEELVGDHLPDSFSLAKIVPPGVAVLDIGSGGGLPALPFAILRPDSAVTLVEPRAKRTAFLLEATRQLSLTNTKTIRGRLEDLSPQPSVFFSSKATFDPQTWIDLALPLCDTESRVVAFLGRETNPDQLVPPPQATFPYRTLDGIPRCLSVIAPTPKPDAR